MSVKQLGAIGGDVLWSKLETPLFVSFFPPTFDHSLPPPTGAAISILPLLKGMALWSTHSALSLSRS
jgi:hypothetical protein